TAVHERIIPSALPPETTSTEPGLGILRSSASPPKKPAMPPAKLKTATAGTSFRPVNNHKRKPAIAPMRMPTVLNVRADSKDALLPTLISLSAVFPPVLVSRHAATARAPQEPQLPLIRGDRPLDRCSSRSRCPSPRQEDLQWNLPTQIQPQHPPRCWRQAGPR